MVPFNSPEGAADLNVVVVGWNDNAARVTSATDSAGNRYTLALGPTVILSNGLAVSQSIYYAFNVKGGTNTVT